MMRARREGVEGSVSGIWQAERKERRGAGGGARWNRRTGSVWRIRRERGSRRSARPSRMTVRGAGGDEGVSRDGRKSCTRKRCRVYRLASPKGAMRS